MYSESAKLYDELHSFKDYAEMASRLTAMIRQYRPGAESFLEVACGTGQFLKRLQDDFRVEGMDISAEMLSIASERCPGVPLHQADMAEFEISHRFDVIACLFSSIAFAQPVVRMQHTVKRMASHLTPKGVLLLEPYFSPETCWDRDLRLNVYDGKDRKIAWMYVTDVKENLAVVEHHYLFGERTGVKHFTERQELGLFTDVEYREAIEHAGLTVSYDPLGIYGRGMYIGTAK
jgi:ubiquinone/menaquinone biosynthesis C-methylase UbiE